MQTTCSTLMEQTAGRLALPLGLMSGQPSCQSCSPGTYRGMSGWQVECWVLLHEILSCRL